MHNTRCMKNDTLNRDIIKITEYGQVNKLQLTTKPQRSPLTFRESDEQSLAFGDVNVEQSTTLDLLGMTIQNDTRWIEHIFDVSKDASKG